MRTYQTKANDGGGADTINTIKMGAGEQNSVLVELANAVSPTGQTLSDAPGTTPVEITNQLAQALFINAIGAQTFQDSGIVNAYIVTPVTGSGGLVVPDSYANMNGAVISFIPSITPSGATTLDFGQTVGTLLGTKKILTLDGSAFTGGEFDTTNYHDFRYDTTADAATGAWIFIGKKNPTTAYAKYSETQASGVDAGAFTAGAWQTRAINTEDSDDNDIGTFSVLTAKITLKAGTYICSASAPAFSVGGHTARLYNTTGAAVVLGGTTENTTTTVTADATTTRSFINGQFTIAASQDLELQHYCGTTKATDGFGKANSLAATSEVYTTLELWKIA